MRNSICLVLIILFANPLLAQNLNTTAEYEDGSLMGKQSAQENFSSGAWFAAGLGGGVLLGLIGAGIVVGISQSGTVEPSSLKMLSLNDKPNDLKMSFYDGYSKKAKTKGLHLRSSVV